MNIGTDKISPEKMCGVPHHLIDFLEPTEDFNVFMFQKLVKEAIADISSRGKIPILVGGTGFYYSAVSEGLGEAGSDSALSKQLQEELDKNGLSYMVEKLRELDSEAAKTIDINNSRRVLRAIEVVISTGKPFSQNKPVSLLPEAEFKPIVVTRPRDILHERIGLRVNQMFEEGLEDEVKHIIEKYGRDAAALSSIGYREWFDYFDGKLDYELLKEQIIIHTRQYAKRQETWFRKKPGVPFIYTDQLVC